jgi:hypothetical protein
MRIYTYMEGIHYHFSQSIFQLRKSSNGNFFNILNLWWYYYNCSKSMLEDNAPKNRIVLHVQGNEIQQL